MPLIDLDAVTARLAVQAEVDAFKASRAVIEQAKGVLMQLLSIDEERAFAVLQRYSQDHNVRVNELARRLTTAATEDTTPGKRDVGAIEEFLDALAAAPSAPGPLHPPPELEDAKAARHHG